MKRFELVLRRIPSIGPAQTHKKSGAAWDKSEFIEMAKKQTGYDFEEKGSRQCECGCTTFIYGESREQRRTG